MQAALAARLPAKRLRPTEKFLSQLFKIFLQNCNIPKFFSILVIWSFSPLRQHCNQVQVQWGKRTAKPSNVIRHIKRIWSHARNLEFFWSKFWIFFQRWTPSTPREVRGFDWMGLMAKQNWQLIFGLMRVRDISIIAVHKRVRSQNKSTQNY